MERRPHFEMAMGRQACGGRQIAMVLRPIAFCQRPWHALDAPSLSPLPQTSKSSSEMCRLANV